MINGSFATEIENIVVQSILNLYSEEKLIHRPIFNQAFTSDTLDIKVLKQECEIILIPWQLFFLNYKNFVKELKHIESQRKHKISAKLLSKRKGLGNVTSKRIVDRLIRLQNFVTEYNDFPKNAYVGSIEHLPIMDAVCFIKEYFNIDHSEYWQYSKKETALNYFIKKIEYKNINVSRGVLTNKILPNHQVVLNEVYKNTSGFVIKDDFIPFIFLPSEINPDEVASRQIYTLVYLLVIIGLNQFDYFLQTDFKTKIASTNKIERKIHSITTELLIPSKEFTIGKPITHLLRDSLCEKFKVTPLALITTLKIRGLLSDEQYENLKPNPYVPGTNKSFMRSPKIKTSIKKFFVELTHIKLSVSEYFLKRY